MTQDPNTEVDPIVITSTEDQQLPPSLTRMHLFPNPVSHSCQVQIDSRVGGPATLLLYNAQGQVLARQAVQLSSQYSAKTVLDMTAYPPGIYAIQLSTDQSSLTSKIIKQ